VTAGDRTSDYDFALPEGRIAQRPLDRRDESRLMIVERDTGRITHGRFRDIEGLPAPSDALVLNTTRVFRARLLGRRDSGASGEVASSASSAVAVTDAETRASENRKPNMPSKAIMAWSMPDEARAAASSAANSSGCSTVRF